MCKNDCYVCIFYNGCYVLNSALFVIMTVMFLFSAGVGRTGTYISIDYLLQFVRDHDLSHKVDVFAWVVKMRKNRVSMVQVDVSHDTCLFWFCMFVCLLTSRSGLYYLIKRRRHCCRRRAPKLKQMLSTDGLELCRDVYRATPALTRDSVFVVLSDIVPIQSPCTTRHGY